jgi:hypothetical protein
VSQVYDSNANEVILNEALEPLKCPDPSGRLTAKSKSNMSRRVELPHKSKREEYLDEYSRMHADPDR